MDDFESPEVQKDFPGLKEEPECKRTRLGIDSPNKLTLHFQPRKRKRKRTRKIKRTKKRGTRHWLGIVRRTRKGIQSVYCKCWMFPGNPERINVLI